MIIFKLSEQSWLQFSDNLQSHFCYLFESGATRGCSGLSPDSAQGSYLVSSGDLTWVLRIEHTSATHKARAWPVVHWQPFPSQGSSKCSAYLVRPHPQLMILAQSKDEGITLHTMHSKAEGTIRRALVTPKTEDSRLGITTVKQLIIKICN